MATVRSQMALAANANEQNTVKIKEKNPMNRTDGTEETNFIVFAIVDLDAGEKNLKRYNLVRCNRRKFKASKLIT
ncbi:Hypothetical predicted protein [Octopus vulgaris]|uniref:Uncharacterized protein n=1 Tax=Octopus vulgaris TaxID=6645 RepID=A0AA36AMN5_OCTVU|nr:Hypothetical predicted protein [Octopus vulgaris]